MNIEFERNGIKKLADERFTADLLAAGWNVVKKEKVVEPKAKKKAK